MCILNKIQVLPVLLAQLRDTAPRGGKKTPAPPMEPSGRGNHRDVEAETSISVHRHTVHHLRLNDKIMLTKI